MSTIAVALATSTPTSITVVATSTSMSPAAYARITYWCPHCQPGPAPN